MLERYNPILNAIKDLCPTAHIGGGAVRDTSAGTADQGHRPVP